MTYKRKEQIGDCTLYLGDCREILPTLGAVDAVVTDPPYGIDYDPTRSHASAASGRRKNAKKIIGDDQRFDASWLVGVGRKHVLWGANHFADTLPSAGGWLVWDKRDGGSLFRGFAMSDCELAWCDVGKMVRSISHKWCGHLRDSEKDIFVHPTQKPVAVMAWCMEQVRVCDEETVFDPFMGSGTTGVACVKLGRKFTGIEIDPGYFDIACRRIEEAYNQPDLFVESAKPEPIEQFDMLEGAQ